MHCRHDASACLLPLVPHRVHYTQVMYNRAVDTIELLNVRTFILGSVPRKHSFTAYTWTL